MSDSRSQPPQVEHCWDRATSGRGGPSSSPVVRAPQTLRPEANAGRAAPSRPPSALWPPGLPLSAHEAWPFPLAQPPAQTLPLGSLGHPEAAGQLPGAKSPPRARRPTDGSGEAACSPRRLLCRGGCSRAACPPRPRAPSGRPGRLPRRPPCDGSVLRHCEVSVALPPHSVHAAVTLFVQSSLPGRAGTACSSLSPQGACPGLWRGLPSAPTPSGRCGPLGLVPSPRPDLPWEAQPLGPMTSYRVMRGELTADAKFTAGAKPLQHRQTSTDR